MEQAGADARFVDIDKSPPSAELLAKAIAGNGIHKVWNTRSPKYRAMGIADKRLSEAEAIKLMQKEPNLIRRPLAVSGETVVQGFDEGEWKKLAEG